MYIAILAHDCREDDKRSESFLPEIRMCLAMTPNVRIFLQSQQTCHEELPANTHFLKDGLPTKSEWELLFQADVILADIPFRYELLNVLPVLAQSTRIIADLSWCTSSPQTMKDTVWWANAIILPFQSEKKAFVQGTGIPEERIHVFPPVISESTNPEPAEKPIVLESDSMADILTAQSQGIPIIAAHSGRISELVGDTGLTFFPGDEVDKERQLHRVLDSYATGFYEQPKSFRVAVVSVRYGTDFVGGAESSLRKIAETLHSAKHHVEVFSTCTKSEGNWRNQLLRGTTALNGVTVHRFRVDRVNRKRHSETVRQIHQGDELHADLEMDYVRHSVHSQELIDQLSERIEEFDAVIVGPYLFGLTYDVAHHFAEKCLVVPCFHDEPLAKLAVWRDVYRRTAGLLYHSVEEQHLAQCQLGVTHPNAVVIGTLLSQDYYVEVGETESPVRKIVYCGRYSEQKGLPQLLHFAGEYHR